MWKGKHSNMHQNHIYLMTPTMHVYTEATDYSIFSEKDSTTKYMASYKGDNVTSISLHAMTKIYYSLKGHLFSLSVRHVRRLPLRLKITSCMGATVKVKDKDSMIYLFIYNPQSMIHSSCIAYSDELKAWYCIIFVPRSSHIALT